MNEGKGGKAPQLVQNHGASDEEIRNMEQWLKTLSCIVHGGNISLGYTEEQIEDAEERLGISLPAELRAYYRTVGNDSLLTTDGNSKKKDRYLPIDEIHVADGNIVYRMRKKIPLRYRRSRDKLCSRTMKHGTGNPIWNLLRKRHDYSGGLCHQSHEAFRQRSIKRRVGFFVASEKACGAAI